MPPSSYLSSGDYSTYGVPSATAAQVTQASVLIDAHLKRPEGLVWSPDSAGNPAYMSAASPDLSFVLGTAVSPGKNVVATVTGPIATLNVGEVLIADRANPAAVEPLTIISNVNGQVTFATAINAHAPSATLEAGLVISEQRYMPKGRPVIMIGRTPVMRIISGIGRYAYPRRGDAMGSNTDDFNLLATFTQFGGPPQWEVFDTTQNTGVDARTGQVWVPAGIMLAYYTEVKLRYVAGFQSSAIPSAIKLACAKLVRALGNDPGLGPAKSYRAGDTAVQMFADTMISGDMVDALRPYRITGLV